MKEKIESKEKNKESVHLMCPKHGTFSGEIDRKDRKFINRVIKGHRDWYRCEEIIQIIESVPFEK